MRVLHVVPSVSPTYGGPSVALAGLLRSLSARGVSCEVLTTELGVKSIDDPEQSIESSGTPIRYFKRRLSSLLPHDFAYSPGMAKWLKGHIGDYDLIHLHGLFSYPNTVSARIALKAGVPYILRTCGMLDPWCLKRSRWKKEVYLRLYDGNVLRHAAAINFTTQIEANVSYKVSGHPKSVVIPLGVYFSKSPAPERSSLTLPDDKKIILFISRIDPKKGLDLLLTALSRLKEVRNDFIAVVAGNGQPSYEAALKEFVKNSGLEQVVKFVGFADDLQKQYLLRRATCFVLPSYQENFGVAVIEAMAVGCPVIISDQVNIKEDIIRARAGHVVACDVGQIFKSLNDLLSDDITLQALAVNGRQLVGEKYSWDVIGEAVYSMYKSCLTNFKKR